MIVADFRIYKYATFYVSRAGPAHYAEPRLSSFFVFFSTANIYIFALRYIRRNGKYGEKAMQTFVKPSSQPSE